MYSSIKNAPIAKRMLIIKDWQIEFTGNPCAAALLGFFDYWHTKTEGKESQSHTEKFIYESLLGVFGRQAIRQGVKTLLSLKVISMRLTGRGHEYTFHPSAVEEWTQNRSRSAETVELADSAGRQKQSSRSAETVEQVGGNGRAGRQKRSSTPYIYEFKDLEEKKEDPDACFVFSEPDPEAIATLPKESWIARPDPEPGTVEVSKPDPKTLSAPRSIKTNVDSSNGSGLRGVKVPPPRVSPQDSSEKVGQFIPTAENFFGPRKQDLAYRFPKHYGAQRYGALALAHFEVPHYWVGPGAWDYAPALIKGAELHLRSLNRPAEQKDCSKWISTRVGNLSKPQESASALLALEHAYAEGERWSKAIAAYEAARMPVEVPQSIAEGDRLPDSSGGDSGAPRGAGKLDLSGLDRIIKGGGLRLDSRVAAEEVRCA